MMKRMLLTTLLLVAVLSLLLAGCGGGKETPAEPSNGLQVTIETKPEKPFAGQETEFRVKVDQEKANVTMFLEMKEMDHGENQVALREVEPGVYQETGVFPMNGVWIAHIRTEKEGQTQTANVELKVQ